MAKGSRRQKQQETRKPNSLAPLISGSVVVAIGVYLASIRHIIVAIMFTVVLLEVVALAFTTTNSEVGAARSGSNFSGDSGGGMFSGFSSDGGDAGGDCSGDGGGDC